MTGGSRRGGGVGQHSSSRRSGVGGGPNREQQLKGQPEPQPHTVHLGGGRGGGGSHYIP